MRFLADMGVARSTVRALRESGHDAVHLQELGLERLDDKSILITALDEHRVVLTFDLDFGDLLASGANTFPSVIIFRLRDQRPMRANYRLLELIEAHGTDLATGALIVVEEARVRIRRLPIKEIE